MFGFGLFNLLFTLVPVLVVGMLIYAIGSNIAQAIHNSQQPLLTRWARVVGRRQEVSRHHHNDHSHVHTAYFVTFEFEDGSREEFSVRGDQYALLAEGDVGTLQSQGTWFKGFDRERASV